MSALRFDCETRLEPTAREALIDGTSMQLVTVCLTDGPGAEQPEPGVRAHLRPREARELAFDLLSLAEHAEQLTGRRR